MLVIGLTGDIGAGKSTVCSLLQQMGAVVVEADRIVRQIWLRPEIIEAARKRWGNDILDSEGRIVASEVASKGFCNEAEYRWMCDLIHPLVMAEMERSLLEGGEGLKVFEIPLLFEVGRPDWIDFAIYVTAPKDVRARRNAMRGLDEEAIAARERWLLPAEEKKKMSDWVIENGGDLKALREEVERLGELLLKIAYPMLVSVTCGSESEAQDIARTCVEKRLAACVNIVPVRSIYSWHGDIEDEGEWKAELKTLRCKLYQLKKEILSRHSYDTPVILAHSLTWVNPKALLWLREVLDI
ncbi:MAG TPA: dephospho-CoA kinase [Acetomicrobium flavidum]|uniref:dephospho-CoA kinase n=2 Tax=Acetomicrobium flavidum TaxID=49896 RepID=UPI002CA9A43E|nr:dephospho-CoA kinase [Acetomicrobium flavidum]